MPLPSEWTALTSHLQKWFHSPDLEALECALSAAAAHPAIKGDPVWLFIQGPSGSGKGEIIVQSLKLLPPYVKVLGAINKNSLISFNRGIPGGELLSLYKKSNGEHTGLFIFKDFTTLLSLREEERTEVISQLREVYDGQWTRSTGVGFHTWKGKVTCIAACTPALESAWALKRDLGERFLTVKWPRSGNSRELAKKAGKQRGFEEEIRQQTSELALAFVSSSPIPNLPLIPEGIFEKISHLAELTAVLRANVHRSPGGKREITGVPVPEEPGRIHKSLSALVSAHSKLFRHEEVGEDDYRIARRVALDSIPTNRFTLFRHLPLEGNLNISTWATLSHHSPSTVSWIADELIALGAIEAETDGLTEIKSYKLSPKFKELIIGAGLKLPL